MFGSEQIEQFHRDGFTVLRGGVSPADLDSLRRTTDSLVEQTRSLRASNEAFELEPDHTAECPRLRRINHPVAVDPLYWRIATSEPMLAAVRALIGPDVKFHHSKLNAKAGGGGASIGWHQDFAFFAHTNFDLLACGVALDDSTTHNGCLLVIPGSHRLGLLNHFAADGRFVGTIVGDEDRFDAAEAVPVELKAGDVSIHHVLTVHGSAQNDSPQPRRLLIFQYAACDALPFEPRPPANDFTDRVVLGKAATHVRVEGAMRLPLRGSTLKRSIFEAQAVL